MRLRGWIRRRANQKPLPSIAHPAIANVATTTEAPSRHTGSKSSSERGPVIGVEDDFKAVSGTLHLGLGLYSFNGYRSPEWVKLK